MVRLSLLGAQIGGKNNKGPSYLRAQPNMLQQVKKKRSFLFTSPLLKLAWLGSSIVLHLCVIITIIIFFCLKFSATIQPKINKQKGTNLQANLVQVKAGLDHQIGIDRSKCF